MPEEFANSSQTLTAHLIDYRKNTRRRMSPMTYVEIDTENGGLLLDISEGGLGLQAAHVLPTARPMPVRFRLPRSGRVVEGSAEVVWLGMSQKQAGVRFVRLGESARAIIQEWIASESGEPQDAPEKAGDGRSALEPQAAEQSAGAAERTPANSSAQSSVEDSPPVHDSARNSAGAETSEATTFEPQIEQAEPALPDYRLNETSLFGVQPQIAVPLQQPARRGGSSAIRNFLWLLALACAFTLGLAIGTGRLVLGGKAGALIEMFGWQRLPTPPEPKIPGDILAKTGAAPATSSADASAEKGPAASDGDGAEPTRVNSQEDVSSAATTDTKVEPRAESASGSAPENTRTQAGVVSPSDRFNPKRQERRAVLVRAAGRGGMPLLLSLPEETLLASRDLAITSWRAVEIAPLQDATLNSKAQRVAVGRLLFHPTPILESQNPESESGSVEILASIGLGGQVLEAKVVGGSAKFGAAAMSAIREWLYEPTLVDGRPVPSQDDLRFVFGHP